MKKKGWLCRCQIEIFVFLIFFTGLLLHVPDMEELDSWCTTYYTVGYEFGFSSRLLVGSLVGLIFPQLYTSNLYVVLMAVGICLCLIAAAAVGRFIKRTGADMRGMAAFLCALWIASPASIVYLFQQNTFGRMDTFLVIDTLLIFMLSIATKNPKKWLGVTALVLAAVLTHQVYVFIYFPLPAAILIHEFFQSEDRKKYGAYGLLLFGSCFALALYLQLFSKVNCANAHEMYEKVIARTSLQNVNETVLQFEYFGKFSDHWNAFGKYMIGDCIKTGLAACALLLPLWIFLVRLWISYRRHTEKKDRLSFWLMMACHLPYIPIFVITVDWGRWFAGFLIFDFLLIFYLLASGDRAMVKCLEEKKEALRTNPAPGLFLLVYLAALGKFDAINVSASAGRLVEYLGKWTEYLGF